MSSPKNLGQYFTPEPVADFMIGLAEITPESAILEPSCGEGIFLKLLEEKGYKNSIGYEIDTSLKPHTRGNIVPESFIGAKPGKTFDLVIGNPPYIRWKNLDGNLKRELMQSELWNRYFNNLCDYLFIFILKSVELLKPGGQLIFITPEYWINTKHASSLRDYLTENGYFSDLFHFSETPVFDGVTSSTVIFRYVKGAAGGTRVRVVKYRGGRLTREVLVNLKKSPVSFTREQFQPGEPWVLAAPEDEARLSLFEGKCSARLGDIADIGNGMVSGLDKAFRIPPGTVLNNKENTAAIKVVKARHLNRYFHGEISRYMFLNGRVGSEAELKHDYLHFANLLSGYRADLEKRYDYHRVIPYWEWVFPRSYGLFKRPAAKIFVPCKERISHKNFIRFSYVGPGMFPTQDVTAIYLKSGVKESIYYFLALLNNPAVFEWIRHRGMVRGGVVEFSEGPLSRIPIRRIDWDNPLEAVLHDEIVRATKKHIETKNEKERDKIDSLLKKLLY